MKFNRLSTGVAALGLAVGVTMGFPAAANAENASGSFTYQEFLNVRYEQVKGTIENNCNCTGDSGPVTTDGYWNHQIYTYNSAGSQDGYIELFMEINPTTGVRDVYKKKWCSNTQCETNTDGGPWNGPVTGST